jgi:hypothetical protein
LYGKEALPLQQDAYSFSQFSIVVDEQDGLGGRQDLLLSSQHRQVRASERGGFLQKFYKLAGRS